MICGALHAHHLIANFWRTWASKKVKPKSHQEGLILYYIYYIGNSQVIHSIAEAMNFPSDYFCSKEVTNRIRTNKNLSISGFSQVFDLETTLRSKSAGNYWAFFEFFKIPFLPHRWLRNERSLDLYRLTRGRISTNIGVKCWQMDQWRLMPIVGRRPALPKRQRLKLTLKPHPHHYLL